MRSQRSIDTLTFAPSPLTFDDVCACVCVWTFYVTWKIHRNVRCMREEEKKKKDFFRANVLSFILQVVAHHMIRSVIQFPKCWEFSWFSPFLRRVSAINWFIFGKSVAECWRKLNFLDFSPFRSFIDLSHTQRYDIWHIIWATSDKPCDSKPIFIPPNLTWIFIFSRFFDLQFMARVNWRYFGHPIQWNSSEAKQLLHARQLNRW